MSSPKYASPLVLKPRTSGTFITVFAVAYLGAMLVVFPLTWYWAWKAALLAVLLISMVITLQRGGVGAIKSLTWKDEAEWIIEFKNGEQYETQLLPSTFMSSWLVVLYFTASEGQPRRSITLIRDALDAESFRRLRVRLNIDKTGSE